MLAAERRNEIEKILVEKKSVSVLELAEHFDVSEETIRRDLRAMETKGVIEKSYGGAVLKERVSHSFSYSDLTNVMTDEKRRIAKVASNFICRSDCIFIDFSTTCGCIADVIGDFPVNVMTSSLDVINKLVEKPNVSLISVGGSWNADNRAFMGSTAIQTISQFHLDKAFISCRALNMENGISDKTEPESELRRKILESANQVYLLADHTKFDKLAFVKTGDLRRITAIITDEELDAKWRSFLTENNILYCCCNK